jgi:DNA-binding transcriptional LysR family regulator
MSDPIDLRHLRNLTVVAAEGNISRAATRLYISQPCLSGQMKQLEETAQVGLLVRHSGGVRATPAAEILIAGSKHILKLCDDLLAAARSTDTVAFLPMRLGFSSFVDHTLFEMVCSIHTSLFPSCEIKSKSGDNVEILDLLNRGEMDAALLTLPVTEMGLKTYAFTQSRLVVCMRADDPLSKLKEITPGDLASKLTIFREPKQHPEAHDRLIEMLAEVGITGDVANTNKSPHDLQWMVESSYGYALIPEGSPLQKGLVTRPISGVTWTVDSALILGRSTSHKTLPALVKELRRRFRLQGKLPPAKPVRPVRTSKSDKNLLLFG